MWAAACSPQGSIGYEKDDTGSPGGRPKGNGGAGSNPDVTVDGPGVMPLRRLSRDEYDRTLRDLLGDTTRPGRALTDDTSGATFASPSVAGLAETSVLLEAAAGVAEAAISKGTKTFGCDPSTDACFTQWLPGFIKRAYRRPVATDEIDGLRALFMKGRGELKYTSAQATSFVLQAILNSPWFLYHWELGPNAAEKATVEGAMRVSLTSYERASRLSYFLWGTMPDEALFAAAETGALSDTKGLVAQARRLMADTKFDDAVASFHRQWLGLPDPEGADAFAKAAADETRAFVTYVFREDGGKLDTLLRSPTLFVNQTLAQVYGISGVTGTALVRRDGPATQRFGLLTQANFLATHGAGADSHPVKRGLQIMKKLLCQELPPPPAMVEPAQPSPNLTTRERYVEHEKNECAKACHGLIDPPGFSLEHYDGAGRWRDKDAGEPVDASGTVDFPTEGKKSFRDFAAFSDLLVKSKDVHRCLATQWASFALGRPVSDQEGRSIDNAVAAFDGSELDVREMLLGFAGSTTFVNRSPASGEVLQ